MSTVAFKDGVIAAESRGTSGDIIRGKVKKLFQLNDGPFCGSVVGIAGDVGYEAEFLAWLEAGANPDKRPDFSGATSFTAIVGSPENFVVYGKELRRQDIGADFYAIGSGNEIALGAMSFGATARQAVECACKFDVYSGGEITEISAKSRPVPRRLPRHVVPKQVPKHPSPRMWEQGRDRPDTRPELQAVDEPSARPDGDRHVDLRR